MKMKSKLGYWRRRGGYRRLDEVRSKERRRKSWSWKIRMPRKTIKLRWFKFNYLKRLIGRVHDAYVRMMIRVASSPVVIRGGGVIAAGYGGVDVGGMGGQFGMRPMKEYDEKMIIQMYNSLVIRRQQQQAQLKLALDPPPPPPQVAVTTLDHHVSGC